MGGKSVTRSLPEFHVDMRMKGSFVYFRSRLVQDGLLSILVSDPFKECYG